MAAVIVVALLGGGGGAYLLRKHAPHTSTATTGVAPQIAPSVVPTRAEAAEPAAPPSTGTAEPLGSVAGSTFPPSEAPIEVPSGHHRHGKHAAEATKGAPAASESAVVSARDFAQDLAPESSPVAAVSAVKVRLSNVHAANVAAASVTAALPVGSFARCYHGPPASHATATVHLDLTKTTTLARCSISDSDLADLGACVVNATKRVLVSGVPAGGATADVQVDFDSP